MSDQPMRMLLDSLLRRLLAQSRGRGPLYDHFLGLRRILATTPDADLRWALADYIDCAEMEAADIRSSHLGGWIKRAKARRYSAATEHVIARLRVDVLTTDSELAGGNW